MEISINGAQQAIPNLHKAVEQIDGLVSGFGAEYAAIESMADFTQSAKARKQAELEDAYSRKVDAVKTPALQEAENALHVLDLWEIGFRWSKLLEPRDLPSWQLAQAKEPFVKAQLFELAKAMPGQIIRLFEWGLEADPVMAFLIKLHGPDALMAAHRDNEAGALQGRILEVEKVDLSGTNAESARRALTEIRARLQSDLLGISGRRRRTQMRSEYGL